MIIVGDPWGDVVADDDRYVSLITEAGPHALFLLLGIFEPLSYTKLKLTVSVRFRPLQLTAFGNPDLPESTEAV